MELRYSSENESEKKMAKHATYTLQVDSKTTVKCLTFIDLWKKYFAFFCGSRYTCNADNRAYAEETKIRCAGRLARLTSGQIYRDSKVLRSSFILPRT